MNWKVTSVLEYMIDRDPCIVGRIGAGPQRYELYPTTPPPSSQPSQACEVRVLLSSLPHVLCRTCQPTTRRELCIWVSIISVLLASLVCFLLGLFFYFFPKLTQVGSFYDPLVFKIVASGYTGKRLIFVFCTKNSNFATVVVIVFQ